MFLALAAGGQMSIPRVDLLPNQPTPYQIRDFKQTARVFDATVFDLNAKGPGLPLVWRVPGAPNLDQPGFGMPSYVGVESLRGKTGEAIACLGSLLGATAAGIDKREWVDLAPQYLNKLEGTVINDAGGKSGATFWYETLPALDFVQLSTQYPKWTEGKKISRGIADAYLKAIIAMNGDFDHTSFSYENMAPVYNNQWREPDAAAGMAYVELHQALATGDKKYLAGAREALKSMQVRESNPTYEILTAYGALSAAYLNAEKGDKWDTPRFVDWCFDPTSPNRVGWGMIAGNWGGYDVGGLMGSTNDGGGYAFAMNTYINAATIAPIARYDDRFSAAIGKWVLNAANASRLFYRDSLPKDQQSSADWPGDPNNGIAYEALHREWNGKSPYAAGDAKQGDAFKQDLGLYGGGYVGLMGALIHRTNVEKILRLDLRATDFLPTKAYQTDLYWNSYDTAQKVTVKVPKGTRIYEAVTNQFLIAKAYEKAVDMKVGLKPHQAIQLVQVPAKGAVEYARNRTLVNGVAIDFNNGRVPLPARVKRIPTDKSVAVTVPPAGPEVSFDNASPMLLKAGNGGSMEAELRFAWTRDNLYFQFKQVRPTTEKIEAPSLAELEKHYWDFECVRLNFDAGREMMSVANVPEITFGWSSKGDKDFAFSADIQGFKAVTTGTAAENNRMITGSIPWTSLYKSIGMAQPLTSWVKPGTKIGCQPMLVDGTYKRQAYLNGKPYTRPTGFDTDSRTLVLRG